METSTKYNACAVVCLLFLCWGKSAYSSDSQTQNTVPQQDNFKIPSFSATHVNWHEPSGQELMVADIDYSADGLRVRETGAKAIHEMLQDFKGERGWFIDHERSVSHELEMIEDPELSEAAPGGGASFLGHEPCGDLKPAEQGPGRWRGRHVTAYRCLGGPDDEVIAIEFVDSILKIVVYRRTSTGFIDELRGLVDRTFHPSHFTPPNSYRDVGKEEFFFGAPALKAYSEH